MTIAEPDAVGRDAAAVRAEAARKRAGQLQQRRAELASGAPPSAETAERARTHALESLERAKGRIETRRHDTLMPERRIDAWRPYMSRPR